MSFHLHIHVRFMGKSLRIESLNYKVYVWSTSVHVVNFQNGCANKHTNQQFSRIPVIQILDKSALHISAILARIDIDTDIDINIDIDTDRYR